MDQQSPIVRQTVDWLKAGLETGSVSAIYLKRLAADDGIQSGDLEVARQSLGVLEYHEPNGGIVWSLPTDDLPAPFEGDMRVVFAPHPKGAEAGRLAMRALLKMAGRTFGLRVKSVERHFDEDDDARWVRCAGGQEAVEKCAMLIVERRKAESRAKRRAAKVAG